MGFLICLGFLAIDFLFELSSNAYVRKWFVVADLAVSALWSFFSLVAFAYMADQWRTNTKTNYQDKIVNSIRAAIAFSFFAIIGFVSLVNPFNDTSLLYLLYPSGHSCRTSSLSPSTWFRYSLKSSQRNPWRINWSTTC